MEKILMYGFSDDENVSHTIHLPNGISCDALETMAGDLLQGFVHSLQECLKSCESGDLEATINHLDVVGEFEDLLNENSLTMAGLSDFKRHMARGTVDNYLLNESPDMDLARAFANARVINVSPLYFDPISMGEMVKSLGLPTPEYVKVGYLFGHRANGADPIDDLVSVAGVYVPRQETCKNDFAVLDSEPLTIEGDDTARLVGLLGYTGRNPVHSEELASYACRLGELNEVTLSLAVTNIDRAEYYMIRV